MRLFHPPFSHLRSEPLVQVHHKGQKYLGEIMALVWVLQLSSTKWLVVRGHHVALPCWTCTGLIKCKILLTPSTLIISFLIILSLANPSSVCLLVSLSKKTSCRKV